MRRQRGSITKGPDKVLLPTLRRNVVSVSYVKEKRENLAKSIEGDCRARSRRDRLWKPT